MTAQELHASILKINAFQLEKAVEGLGEDQASARVNEHTMSAMETFAHLAEGAAAWNKKVKGESHEWGTYTVADASLAGSVAAWKAERAAAIESLATASDDLAMEFGFYVTTHEPYHVGQLCTLRLTLDPSWNPYSIYEME